MTDWEEFLNLDYAKLGKLMHNPTIVDGRNVLDKAALQEAGFTYLGIGH